MGSLDCLGDFLELLIFYLHVNSKITYRGAAGQSWFSILGFRGLGLAKCTKHSVWGILGVWWDESWVLPIFSHAVRLHTAAL